MFKYFRNHPKPTILGLGLGLGVLVFCYRLNKLYRFNDIGGIRITYDSRYAKLQRELIRHTKVCEKANLSVLTDEQQKSINKNIVSIKKQLAKNKFPNNTEKELRTLMEENNKILQNQK